MALVNGGSSCILVIVFVIIACQPACGLQVSCPSTEEYCSPGWRRWGNSCYRLTNRKRPYNEAEDECKSLRGKIAAPRSAEENKFFVKLAEKIKDIWIACWNDGEQLLYSQSQTFNNLCDEVELAGCVSSCNSETRCVTGTWSNVPCNNPNYQAVCIIRPRSQPKYCFHTGKDSKLSWESLDGHTIRNLNTPTVVGCGRACVDEPQCRSFNIKRDSQRQKIFCQLNSATRCDAPGDFRENTSDFSLYSDDINVEQLP